MKINKDIVKDGAIILLTFIVCFGIFKKCTQPAYYAPINLKPELKIRDSFRTVIKYHDSTRIVVLKKWRNLTRITDSIKCYTEIVPFIQACDSVILVDSILISSLYGQHKNDSIIQLKQDSIIDQKTDSLKVYKRKLKRQKLFTKGAFFLGVVGGGAIGIKATRP